MYTQQLTAAEYESRLWSLRMLMAQAAISYGIALAKGRPAGLQQIIDDELTALSLSVRRLLGEPPAGDE